MQVSNNNLLNFGLTIKPTTFRTDNQKSFLHECIDTHDSPLLWLDENLRISRTGDMFITERKDGNTEIAIKFYDIHRKPSGPVFKETFYLWSKPENIKNQLNSYIKQGNRYMQHLFRTVPYKKD